MSVANKIAILVLIKRFSEGSCSVTLGNVLKRFSFCPIFIYQRDDFLGPRFVFIWRYSAIANS